MTAEAKCPTCGSPDPMRHPAVQFEGEVSVCPDRFHPRTEHTITEQEIRELYESLDPDNDDEGALRIHCSTALMPERAMSAAALPLARTAARKRCAVAWNARHGGAQ